MSVFQYVNVSVTPAGQSVSRNNPRDRQSPETDHDTEVLKY